MTFNGPLYDYLVVVDLEATCDEGENPQVTRANQEVIEFPWVVVDTVHGQVVDSRQQYCKPEWSKSLTPFCTQLTGITNEVLATAGTLRDAVQQFDTYVYTSFITSNKSFCLITDGSWDLKYMLRSEATAKGIKLAAHYSRFFDLRTEFAHMHKGAHANNLTAMLAYLGLQMEGRHHSGISDCMNISKIVSRLIKDGHRFQSPETIPDNFVPEDNFKDFNQTRSNANMHQQQAVHGQYANGPESCVRLRGLPWSATEADVVRFFSPLHPNSMHLTVNSHGRATGEGYVEFASETDANAALEYHRRLIGTRYVEVFKCSRADMARAANPPGSTSSAVGQAIVRMRGIPYSAAPSDISAFFGGFDIVPNGITIVTGRDGRPSGEAYVQFSSDEHAEAAVKTKHREKIANRYIELFRSSNAEMMHVTNPAAEYQTIDPNHNITEPVCVRMLGLPYSANAGDVLNFFEGQNIVPGGIHFLLNGSGRSSGQGYVEFATVEDATRALERHRSSMGSRYVELFRCTKGEMLMELQGQAGLQLPGANMGVGGHMGYGAGSMGMAGGAMGMNAAMAALSALGGLGPGGGGMGGGMGGMGYGGMTQQQLAEIYALLQQMGMMNPMGAAANPGYGAWPPQAQAPPAHGGGGRYGGGGGGGGMMGGGGGGMGSVNVKLRGLPYHATVGDVAAFFAGYDVNRNAIVLGGGADGRPSGEAWVQFASPEEAARAVQEKHRAHMGSRYLELFLV